MRGALSVLLLLAGCAVPETVFFTDTGPLPPPAWSEGQARWTWREIPGSSLALGPPPLAGAEGSASARIDAWAGLSVDERTGTVYLAASGGDGDYPGNEVLALPLADAEPRWTTLLDPTPLTLTTLDEPYYLDGRPASRQTFYRAIFVERRGRLMLFGGDLEVVELRSVDAFDPVTGAWDPPASFPDLPYDADGQEPAIAEDPDTGDVWVFGGYQVHRWIEASNRWAAVVPSGLMQSGYQLVAALDTRRHRVLLVGSDTEHAYTFDVDDGAWVDRGPIALDAIRGGGLVFVPGASAAEDVFLLRGAAAGPSVVAIDAESLVPSPLPTTGGEAIPPSLHGVYGRFRTVRRLGGVVFYPRYEGNLFFLRTDP